MFDGHDDAEARTVGDAVPEPRHTSSSLMMLALVVMFVAGLLGWWASSTGLCNDELLYLRAIDLGMVDGLMAEGSSHPPLFRWFVAPFVDSSSPDWLLRVPSILCVIATIAIWYFIFQQLFKDRTVSAAVLLLTACNVHWLEAGFLLLPYAMLAMLGSAHALFWFRLVRTQSRFDILGFVLTGAATIWTHFYGANLLVADQLIWVCIVLRQRNLFRLWLSTSLLSLLLVLPVIPVASFYLGVEKPFALVEIQDFPEYFLVYSQQFFSSLTFNVKLFGSLIVVWYGIVLVAVLRFFFLSNSGAEKVHEADCHRLQLLIVAGLFLAGLPAAQAHSVIFQKAMWPRYTLVASWTHWPLLFLFLQQFRISKFVPRAIAVAAIGAVIFGLVFENHARPNVAFDYRHEVDELRLHSVEGDGILLQDFDFWIGPANGDRLWYQRYSPIELKPISSEAKTRFEIYEEGIDFDSVPPSIDRFWVYSGLFNEKLIRNHESPSWNLVFLEYGDCPWFPLALFERATDTSDDKTPDERIGTD